jgi:hypothetical protein
VDRQASATYTWGIILVCSFGLGIANRRGASFVSGSCNTCRWHDNAVNFCFSRWPHALFLGGSRWEACRAQRAVVRWKERSTIARGCAQLPSACFPTAQRYEPFQGFGAPRFCSHT